MSRLACFFGWHRTYPGISRDMAFTVHCSLCVAFDRAPPRLVFVPDPSEKEVAALKALNAELVKALEGVVLRWQNGDADNIPPYKKGGWGIDEVRAEFKKFK